MREKQRILLYSILKFTEHYLIQFLTSFLYFHFVIISRQKELITSQGKTTLIPARSLITFIRTSVYLNFIRIIYDEIVPNKDLHTRFIVGHIYTPETSLYLYLIKGVGRWFHQAVCYFPFFSITEKFRKKFYFYIVDIVDMYYITLLTTRNPIQRCLSLRIFSKS